ncbi:hypothetical protein TIFTF001_022930 [Ficus carica]|uniref:Replication protein A OB domain-containing protein n=1 Tax=Ficus carica TaxID=3494 RepID=A0AA88DFX0_FICCA|nr:hypothetical protein TIFTF001_022930 [Ficus carica]
MFSPIRVLKPGETHQAICARVCRLWRNTDYKTGRLISLDCLLVDKQDEAIHCFIRASDADFMTNKIQEDDDPEIPRLKFNFVEFDQLTQKIDINDLLSDVIGRIISIKSVEDSVINDRSVKRRSVTIQNIREEMLNVTLWGELGEKFDEDAIQAMSEPVVVAFSAMAAKQYMVQPTVMHSIAQCNYAFVLLLLCMPGGSSQ